MAKLAVNAAATVKAPHLFFIQPPALRISTTLFGHAHEKKSAVGQFDGAGFADVGAVLGPEAFDRGVIALV